VVGAVSAVAGDGVCGGGRRRLRRRATASPASVAVLAASAVVLGGWAAAVAFGRKRRANPIKILFQSFMQSYKFARNWHFDVFFGCTNNINW
jgi:hypothetical protein